MHDALQYKWIDSTSASWIISRFYDFTNTVIKVSCELQSSWRRKVSKDNTELERLLIERCSVLYNTVTKVITLANHNYKRKWPNEPIRTPSKTTCNRRQARENTRASKSRLVWVSFLYCLRKWCETSFFRQWKLHQPISYLQSSQAKFLPIFIFFFVK